MSLVRSSATVGFYSLLSRALGFIRDITIAAGIGAGFLSDAFFVAFKVPNFLRRLFAEGAFSVSFVPMFAGMLAVDGKEKAHGFASDVMSFLLMALLVVAGLFIAAMPWLMYLLAPGFAVDPDKFELTILLTRITMPYIVFISLVSLLAGVLNSLDKFAAVAATPILMNLCLITVPWLIQDITPTMAHGLAISVFMAGLVQWLWLVWFCRRQGMLPRLVKPRLTPQVKRLLIIMAPAALGAGVAQINLFVDVIIASQFESGVSYLYYADRINGLPLAVIGVAVGTALLPMLSRQVREGKAEIANHSHHRAIELAMFLTIPSAFGIFIMSEAVVRVMFLRGEFTLVDMVETGKVLRAFALGLPAFVLIKVLVPGYFARQDTKTPFKIATVCVVINIVVSLMLMEQYKYVGMAIATTTSAWVNVLMLAIGLHRHKWLEFPKRLHKESAKILTGCVLMGAVVMTLQPYVQAYLLQDGEAVRILALIVWVLAGVATYFAMAFVTDSIDIRARARKRRLPVP
ncbi:MAG: murein biosynthesis integral membrane protein MurJ [Alphaproteobacteria bacterium]